jgi:serine protease AprX
LSTSDIPEKLVYAEVTLKAPSGASLAKNKEPLTLKNLSRLKADPETQQQAIHQLTKRGFRVIASSPFAISIVGSKKLFKDHFQTDILLKEKKSEKKQLHPPHPIMAQEPVIPQEMASLIETVFIPPAVEYHSGEEPDPNYWHIGLPDDVCKLLKADKAHAKGFKGYGVKVAMVDSGLRANHVYFCGKHYKMTIHGTDSSVVYNPNVKPSIAEPGCLDDSIGHGTPMAANLLAVAPECEFHMFKIDDKTLYNTAHIAAFRNAYQEPGVKVISCSWGFGSVLSSDLTSIITSDILIAIGSGITVVFSCGNTGGYPAFPACMPDVISVGGVMPTEDGQLIASNFARSGKNQTYPDYDNRTCPDVCGLCGPKPYGLLIHMPTQCNSEIDQSCSSNVLGVVDGTPSDDGWVIGSGTSAAAAEVAGAVALVLSAKSYLEPADIKQILEETAIDIIAGTSASGDLADNDFDCATGHGLVDLEAAVELATQPHRKPHGGKRPFDERARHPFKHRPNPPDPSWVEKQRRSRAQS